MAKKLRITKNESVPIFIENQQFDFPEAYTAFCLDRASKMSGGEKEIFFRERLEQKHIFGIETTRKSFGLE